MPIKDYELADELIARLNDLLETPEVKKDIGQLIETRIQCSMTTVQHATIITEGTKLGVLGLINGLMDHVGGLGPHRNWGRVSAVFDDNNELVRFQLTKPRGEPAA